MFVLIMQFLWKYMDEIIGKGAGLMIISELLFYLSISLIPMALTIAVLIASVMVLGNLSEKHELTSMKTAGIPLIRIMQPLIILTIGIAILSYVCSNYINPLANLSYKTRLHDISTHKMTLQLETGVFNEDFNKMSLYIGKKNTANGDIEDVIIYDYSASQMEPTQILAKSGNISTSKDGNFLIMHLYDGTQYQESAQIGSTKKKKYPYSRTAFKRWHKIFNLSEFDVEIKETERFENHYSVLSVEELIKKIDSLDAKIQREELKLQKLTDKKIVSAEIKNNTPTASSLNKKINHRPYNQKIEKAHSNYQNFANTFTEPTIKKRLIATALSAAKNQQQTIKSIQFKSDRYKEYKVKHIYEMHMKFSTAVICIIFLFIGAPMGAIIRKGGFGSPVLIAIIFFMCYIVLTIFCEKLAESFKLDAYLSAWLPCLILLPIGFLLTYKAMNDSELPSKAVLINKVRNVLMLK